MVSAHTCLRYVYMMGLKTFFSKNMLRRLGFAMHPSKVTSSVTFCRPLLTSVLDNILFNLPYDEDRYLKTLEVISGVLPSLRTAYSHLCRSVLS